MKTNDGTSAEKGRRITVDLTSAAADEVDRLKSMTGLTTADLFRSAFSLFRIYVEAKSRGQQLCIIDPENDNAVRTRVELPVVVPPATVHSHPYDLGKGVHSER